MFSITVLYGSTPWLLLFHKEETAKAVVTTLLNVQPSGAGITVPGTREVTDDFGQTIHIIDRPTAVMFEDMEKSRLLHVEHHLHRARIQADTVKRAEADQSLRSGRQGTSILTPMMMPNGRG